MKHQVRLLEDQLIVDPIEKENQTESGLYIPDNGEEEIDRGFVSAIGKGQFDKDGNRVPMTVKLGDEVLFTPGSTSELKIDDETYTVMREDAIIAIIDHDD